MIRDFQKRHGITPDDFSFAEKGFQYALWLLLLKAFLNLEDNSVKRTVLRLIRPSEIFIQLSGFEKKCPEGQLDSLKRDIEQWLALVVDETELPPTVPQAGLALFGKAGELAHKFMYMASRGKCSEIKESDSSVHLRLSNIIQNHILMFPKAVEDLKVALKLK